MRYRAIIFDLDGTVLYTLQDLTDSLNYGLGRGGLPQKSLEEVRRVIGHGIRRLIADSAPSGTDEGLLNRVYLDLRSYYRAHLTDNTEEYPGIRELLQGLTDEGLLLGVASNKDDALVKKLMEHFFPQYIKSACGFLDGSQRKPAPDCVNRVLEELGCRAEECLYVGDSEVDLETAENSGMPCILVDWGFRDRELLNGTGAPVIVSSASELKEQIDRLNA